MKNQQTPFLLALFVLFAAAADTGRAQGGPQVAQPPRPAAQNTLDRGRLEAGVYTNDYLGVSFTVPQGWVTQDVAERQAIIDAGRKMLEDSNAKDKAAIEASMNRTVFLLSISKHPLGVPSPGFNAQLSCLAERVPTAVIKTGDEYLAEMKRVAQATSASMEWTGPVRRVLVGEVAFATTDAKLSVGAGSVAQRHYVTVRKGYAVLLTYSYLDEADLKAFDELIKSMKFK